METTSERHWSIFFLILLVTADLAFIGLELLHSWGYARDPKFSLGRERGYAEIYQYIKLLWITFILSRFAFEKRQAIYGVGALLFFYLLLDDSLEIHETAGRIIGDRIGIESAFGLRGQDYGELGVSAFAGVFFLTAGWLAYRYSDALARKVGVYLLISLFVLALFGVGADMLHQFVANKFPWSETPLLILEDGGELIVVSAICWFVYSLANQELSHLDIPSPFP